jgi:hypothetical protein
LYSDQKNQTKKAHVVSLFCFRFKLLCGALA